VVLDFRIFDLLKIARQAQSGFYIRVLSTLVSYRLDISRAPGSEPLNSDPDSRPRAAVAQAVEPVSEAFGLADLKHKLA
jgi:hypothetical protein